MVVLADDGRGDGSLARVALRSDMGQIDERHRPIPGQLGVHVGKQTRGVKLEGNKIEGFKSPVVREAPD